MYMLHDMNIFISLSTYIYIYESPLQTRQCKVEGMLHLSKTKLRVSFPAFPFDRNIQCPDLLLIPVFFCWCSHALQHIVDHTVQYFRQKHPIVWTSQSMEDLVHVGLAWESSVDQRLLVQAHDTLEYHPKPKKNQQRIVLVHIVLVARQGGQGEQKH